MLRRMIVMGVVASLLMVASAQAATVNVTSVFNAEQSTGDVGWAGDHAWINNAGDSAVFDVYLTFDEGYSNVTGVAFSGAFGVNVADYFAKSGETDPESVWGTVDYDWNGIIDPKNPDPQMIGSMNKLTWSYDPFTYVEATTAGTGKIDLVEGFNTIVAGETYKLGTMTITALTDVPAGQRWDLVFGLSDGDSSIFTVTTNGTKKNYVTLGGGMASVDTTVAIPEPGTYAMLCGLGLVGAAIYRRRKNAR